MMKPEKWMQEYDDNLKFDREMRVQETELRKIECFEQKEWRQLELEEWRKEHEKRKKLMEHELQDKKEEWTMHMEMFKMYLESKK